MSWFDKILPSFVSNKRAAGVPEGVWSQCEHCHATIYSKEFNANLKVCLKCDHHHRLSAAERLAMILDAEGQVVLADDVIASDRLKFKDSKRYKDRLLEAQRKTQESEALKVCQGTIYQDPVVVAVFEFGFIGGSMGSAVGERFVQAVNQAIAKRCPLICFATSGGARMQEGLISLMQMSKTSAAIAQLNRHRLPYITVLVDPTMGGVSASLAMLGDVIIAEPQALVGFAGPRVIEQTVKQVLPEGFQRSEFLLENGAIDMIVHRRDMKARLSYLIKSLMHHHEP